MKYAGEYYKSFKKFLKSKSNMNRLCWDIEKWHKKLQWKRRDKNFDYKIMIDDSVQVDETIIDIMGDIYLEFNKELVQMKKDEISINKELKTNHDGYGNNKEFEMNWDIFYDSYREKCRTVCPDSIMLANSIVKVCYEKYPKGSKGFMWHMAGEEIVNNIKQAKVLLPIRDRANDRDKDKEGDMFEYLGKRYGLVLMSQ